MTLEYTTMNKLQYKAPNCFVISHHCFCDLLVGSGPDGGIPDPGFEGVREFVDEDFEILEET